MLHNSTYEGFKLQKILSPSSLRKSFHKHGLSDPLDTEDNAVNLFYDTLHLNITLK